MEPKKGTTVKPLTFGPIFRALRVQKRKTLRELAACVGKSIGYLSDIEHGRVGPPPLSEVEKIERCLGVSDGRLVALANRLRQHQPRALAQRLSQRPELAALMMRADELSDAQLKALHEAANQLGGEEDHDAS